MPYQYDIYLGYDAKFPLVDWVHESFSPFLSAQLSDLLGRPLSVFDSSAGILLDNEQQKQRSLALANSRCYLPILTPAFFTKTYLKQEFAEVLIREKLLGYRTMSKPYGLIMPVVIRGMSALPAVVKQIQLFDLSSYAIVGAGFTKTVKYVELQEKIEVFGNAILRVIENAPAWDASWTNLSGFLNDISSLLIPLIPKLDISTNDTTLKSPIDMPDIKKKIFLSYAREDQPQVIDLYNKLKNSGFQPWLDIEDLLPGEDWDLEIRKAIRNSKFFLACLSKKSVAKRGYIQKELKMGIDVLAEFPEGEVYLIPVRLDDCELPDRIKSLQAANLFESTGFNKLKTALESV
jgi:hypothetical protein